LQPGNVIIISKNGSQPIIVDQPMKHPGKISSGPNVPGCNDQKKDQHVVPMEQRAESETGFTVKNSEQRKNGDKVD
jgi:hypothetical protein